MAEIRGYRPEDRDALYRVCLRTGDDGADATDLYRQPRLLGDVYVGPYVAFEPRWAWVVEQDGAVAGYILCAPNTAAFDRRCDRDWWPALRERYPLHAFAAGTRDAGIVRLIHDPPRVADAVLEQFPAHLHIDLAPEVQGLGLGGALMTVLLDALRADGVAGIHLGVSSANARAIGFYERLGFTVLSTFSDGQLMGLRLTSD
jgi:ribosomal protein S18 acetylase RimI-like enzyme